MSMMDTYGQQYQQMSLPGVGMPVNLGIGAKYSDLYRYMANDARKKGALYQGAMDDLQADKPGADSPIVPTIGASSQPSTSGIPIKQAGSAAMGFAAGMTDSGTDDSRAAYAQWLMMQQQQKAQQNRLQQIAQQNAQMMQQQPTLPNFNIAQQAAMMQFQAAQMLPQRTNPALRNHKYNTGGPMNTGRTALLGV